ncbi:MAG: hypothetical protein QOH14_1431 [Pseudonocardiales bacterium]|nr:hypothetical protein [Pseudonocardiales bacterium]
MTTALRPAPAVSGYRDLRRTALALVATGLGLLPLNELFTDVRWVFDAWLGAAVVFVPGLALRGRQPARPWHTWLGLALLVPWLTLRFVPHSAFLGLIPTTATWHDIDALLSGVRDTSNNGVAPVHPTPAVHFALAVVAGLFAAFVDLIAVVGHRAALAGVPMLVIYTVAGAVPRHPVSWLLFGAAAAGFLLLLSLDSQDTIRQWGRLIPRRGDARATAGLGVSGPRIALIAVGLAILLPLVTPSRPSNLIADALHNGTSNGSGGGGGFGANGGVSLDPFAALKGELQRPKPVNLFTVSITPGTGVAPFYLRANVLATYTDRGWTAATHSDTEKVSSSFFDTLPSTPSTPSTASTDNFQARIDISSLADNPPVFANPTAVDGVSLDATWSRTDQLVLGPRVHRGQQITEEVQQPAPTTAQLAAAGPSDPAQMTTWLQQPANLPQSVRNLVDQLTAAAPSPYAKARALSDYFTNPANGFTYSLETKSGDSGNALVDFLATKSGYCQQYAAAMGIMLRMAGVPSRVVLGYTHAAPNADGQFTVTTSNAHAWVEAYFDGLGWIPFDPTPIAGAAGGATTSLPWGPHPTLTSVPGGGRATGGQSNSANNRPSEQLSSNAPGAGGAARGPGGFATPVLALLGGLGVVLVAALVPAAVRWRRRRGRLHAARAGNPDPLWAELSDTAVDLGYVWSAARSPRQVVRWLEPQVGRDSVPALQTLAAAVESARYAPESTAPESTAPGFAGDRTLVKDLRAVEAQLRARRGAATRIRSRLLPASLAASSNGWPRLRPGGQRRR